MPHYTINATVDEDAQRVGYVGMCNDCGTTARGLSITAVDADMFAHVMGDCPKIQAKTIAARTDA